MIKLYYPICFLFIMFSSASADTEALTDMEDAADANREPRVITGADGALIRWEGSYTIGNYHVVIERDSTGPGHLIDVRDSDGSVTMTTSTHCRFGSVQAILGTYAWQGWIILFGEVERKYTLNAALYFNVEKPELNGCVGGHRMSFSPAKNRVAYEKFVSRPIPTEIHLPQVFIHDFPRDDYIVHYPPPEWGDDQGHIFSKKTLTLYFDEEPGDDYVVGSRLQYFPSSDANDESGRWIYREPQSGFIWSKCSNRLAFLSKCIKENRLHCGIWLTIVDFDETLKEPDMSRHLLSGSISPRVRNRGYYEDLIWSDDGNLLLTVEDTAYIISSTGDVKRREIQETQGE